jgi:hypothetical protein
MGASSLLGNLLKTKICLKKKKEEEEEDNKLEKEKLIINVGCSL